MIPDVLRFTIEHRKNYAEYQSYAELQYGYISNVSETLEACIMKTCCLLFTLDQHVIAEFRYEDVMYNYEINEDGVTFLYIESLNQSNNTLVMHRDDI